MKNGNLAPTFLSLFLCMLWHGDTRSTPWPFTAFVESLPCMCHTDGTWDGTLQAHTGMCLGAHKDFSRAVPNCPVN